MLGSPSFEKPDEPGHFDYIRFVSLQRRLPGPLPGYPHMETAYEGHQPPLYYVLQAGLLTALDPDRLTIFETDDYNLRGIAESYVADPREAQERLPRPNTRSDAFGGPEANMFVPDVRDEFPYRYPYLVFRALRLPGLLFGLLTVLAVYRLSVLFFGAGSPWIIAATAILAFNPQFCFIAGSVGNDTLAIFLSAWLAYFALKFAVDSPKGPTALGSGLLIGILLGLAILTKLNAIPHALFVLACLLVPARAHGKAAIYPAAACLLAAAGVAGWFFMRNIHLYGDPFALAAMKLAHPHLLNERSLWAYFLPFSDFSFPSVAFESFWAGFGWLNIRVNPAIMGTFLALSLFGAAGAAIRIYMRWRAGRRRLTRHLQPSLLLMLHAGLSLAFMVRLNLEFMQPQGRYLFVSLAPVSILLAEGLRYWTDRLTPAAARIRRLSPALLASLLLILNLLCLIEMLRRYAA